MQIVKVRLFQGFRRIAQTKAARAVMIGDKNGRELVIAAVIGASCVVGNTYLTPRD